MEHLIKIDLKRCIGCGKCVKDCPQFNIEIDNRNKAVVKSQDCIKCGHCVAVCPMEAVSISGYDEKPYRIEDMEKIDPTRLMNSLISRRSIRAFKEKDVPEEIIQRIIEAGRWTPTGKNAQDVEYIIIQKKKRQVEAIAIKVFKRILKLIKVFRKSYKDIVIDEKFFFKGAPLVIVVVSKSSVDGALAASNMALMAEANGLGVLYSGFFTVAARVSGKIRKELEIKGKKPITTLVIGYSDVEYRRSVQKERAAVIRK